MKMIKVFVLSLLVLFFLSSLTTAINAEKEMSKEDMEMMKKWQTYATPGANHKYLEMFAGKWTAKTKSWMKPGAPPDVSDSDIEAKMIMGGRFLKAHVKGKMMGIPFEGISLTGYDNFQKKFNTIWFDSMGTGIFPASGTLDKDGKVKTDMALWDDFMTGSKSKVKMLTTIIDKDNYTFEMFMIGPDGKEMKSMEMVYTRKK
jgi:Protein of unknown function (DUF1579)